MLLWWAWKDLSLSVSLDVNDVIDPIVEVLDDVRPLTPELPPAIDDIEELGMVLDVTPFDKSKIWRLSDVV